MRSRSVIALCLALALILPASSPLQAVTLRERPEHHLLRGFRNLAPGTEYPLIRRARRLVRQTIDGWPERGPALRVYPNDGTLLRQNGHDPTITWVGHATVLIQLEGINILTDPHWGDAVGPVRVPGLRRLISPGLEFDHLPRIDAVVISHDHWDHLDLVTVRRLAARWQPTFFVPLGLRELLMEAGARHIVELDWWESAPFGPARFTATPAQHTSGRGIGDQGLRLWSSWMISSHGRSTFFAGDTGYHGGFTEVRRRLGAPDVAILPIGGYLTHDGQHPNHLNPEEAVHAFRDLGATRLVPMHWGTFELNHEPFGEPPARLRREAAERGLGPALAILDPGQTLHW